MRGLKRLAIAACFAGAALAHAAPAPTDRPLTELVAEIAGGRATPLTVLARYRARIARLNPVLHAVIALDPTAEAQTRRAHGRLAGAPILLKDNIDAAGLPTTAGSLALAANRPAKDAAVAARLRAAGAVILGKANLSEWANFRSSRSIGGWSAVGGLTRNPYALDRTTSGSSSGSGAAVAAGLAAAAIGTETDGSLTAPAALMGLVALKPTVGLVSRAGIVPISASQDTPGPMTRTVADAALLLTVMAGADPADPATREADAHRADYLKGLDPNALKGARLGVLRTYTGRSTAADAVFEQALAMLRAQGAVLVEVPSIDEGAMSAAEQVGLDTEFKAGIAAYLATTDPAQVKSRTLADLIAFDAATPAETPWFGQETFERAERAKGLDDPAYLKARADARRLAGPEGIDRRLADDRLVALVSPTTGGPASVIDPVNGAKWMGSISTPPAVAGYPHLTVPMGQVSGLPVGLSFIGPAWSEQTLLSLGYAYEQATHARRAPPEPYGRSPSP